jgi:hypothetical protein
MNIHWVLTSWTRILVIPSFFILDSGSHESRTPSGTI